MSSTSGLVQPTSPADRRSELTRKMKIFLFDESAPDADNARSCCKIDAAAWVNILGDDAHVIASALHDVALHRSVDGVSSETARDHRASELDRLVHQALETADGCPARLERANVAHDRRTLCGAQSPSKRTTSSVIGHQDEVASWASTAATTAGASASAGTPALTRADHPDLLPNVRISDDDSDRLTLRQRYQLGNLRNRSHNPGSHYSTRPRAEQLQARRQFHTSSLTLTLGRALATNHVQGRTEASTSTAPSTSTGFLPAARMCPSSTARPGLSHPDVVAMTARPVTLSVRVPPFNPLGQEVATLSWLHPSNIENGWPTEVSRDKCGGHTGGLIHRRIRCQ